MIQGELPYPEHPNNNPPSQETLFQLYENISELRPYATKLDEIAATVPFTVEANQEHPEIETDILLLFTVAHRVTELKDMLSVSLYAQPEGAPSGLSIPEDRSLYRHNPAVYDRLIDQVAGHVDIAKRYVTWEQADWLYRAWPLARDQDRDPQQVNMLFKLLPRLGTTAIRATHYLRPQETLPDGTIVAFQEMIPDRKSSERGVEHENGIDIRLPDEQGGTTFCYTWDRNGKRSLQVYRDKQRPLVSERGRLLLENPTLAEEQQNILEEQAMALAAQEQYKLELTVDTTQEFIAALKLVRRSLSDVQR